MTLSAWFVMAVILACFIVLITTTVSADIVFMSALTILIASNIIPVEDALTGFSNEGMLTVAALYVVAAGLKETGAIQLVVNRIIGQTKSVTNIQMRLMAPVIVISAFINNTPIVASFIPALESWSRKSEVSVSKLLIPLSYAAILGGTCTLIGTSTNLIVNGLLLAEESIRGIGIFELAYVGVPCALVGFVYIILVAPKLLPEGGLGFDTFEDPRQYTIEMLVESGSSLAGKTLSEAGLYGLPGLFLIDIYRDKNIIPVTNAWQRLREGDRLIFAGVLDSVVELQQIKGLKPATEQIFKLDVPRRDRVLVEAVISPEHPLIHRTVREGRFRNLYDAVVLAVARNGEQIRQQVGEIRFKAGDTLLLEALPTFWERYKNSRDYYLISVISNFTPAASEKSKMAWSILIGMVVLVTTGLLNMFQASFLAAVAIIFTGCCRPKIAKDNIDWSVLLVIAASIGLGNALQITGAAGALANGMLSMAAGNPYLALAITYLATTILTETINNNSAAVLVFPIAISIASAMELSLLPFAIVIMMAASASFATPIGYQTNLMVYGPGGYKFTDFTKIGLPLNILVGIVTIILVPIIWPL